MKSAVPIVVILFISVSVSQCQLVGNITEGCIISIGARRICDSVVNIHAAFV